MIKTDIKSLGRALEKINSDLIKRENIAKTRTLNIILKEERQKITDDVSAEFGVLKGSVKSHMKPVKATRGRQEIKLKIHSTRTSLVQPKPVKGGISFRKSGGGRTKIKNIIKKGSKPFIIKAKAGGQLGGEDIKIRGGIKKVPVYVPEKYNKFRGTSKRRVTTFKGSSLKVMVQKIEFDGKKLEKAVIRKFSSIYQKQIVKAKFTGRK